MKYHFLKHFHTVNKHRFLVFINECKVGIPFLGLKHDLSKYSPKEFINSAKYYNGHYSPIVNERLNEGLYSSIFNHHTNKNKHHYEYYIDVNEGDILLIQMPFKYSLEYVIDVISASKTYLGKDFKKDEPLKFFLLYKDTTFMHSMTLDYITQLLTLYSKNGFKSIKKKYSKKLYKEYESRYPKTELIKCYSINNKLERVPLTKENIEKYKKF